MDKDGKPLQATAGGEHSLILDKLGSIYSAGACGAGWNRCKELSEDLFGWRPVPISEKIVQLKAGYYHNLALAQSGSVYSWGCGTFVDGNNDGVIPALGNSKSDLGSSPEILKGLDSVDSVDSGAYHSVLLTKSNRVLTLGSAQLGQLGRDTDGSELDASNLPVDSIPREVQGIPKGERINSIGAGFYNTFAACKSGALFCSGENQNQQCGASSSNIMKMTRIQELKDKLILHATGGYCHTMVLTNDGEVFTLGCAVDGQRGDGREVEDPSRPIVTPIHLPTKQKVLQMAAGANHSMIIGEDGKVYAFGSNEFGQCGIGAGGADVILKPTLVNLPQSAGRAVSVSCGYAHTVIKDDLNRIYSFGQNTNGQLGQGAHHFKAPIDIILPTLIDPTRS